MALSLSDIRAAQKRISPYIVKTPVLTSTLLNTWLGHEVYFKCENFQKVGAFKARGGVNTVGWLIENGIKPKKIIANSSGNHAQAVAFAGKQFGIPVTIYMPEYSSDVKIKATKSYGAEVVLSKDRNVTDSLVKEASKEEGTYWIPPFNHEQVICGQGTAVLEGLEEIEGITAVFTPCGGGGLASGSLIAAKGFKETIKAIGVEPLNANDAAESLRKNSIQKLQGVPNTLADGAMTLSVGDITFEYLKQLDAFYEIAEESIVYWTQWLTHLLKIRLEPTCAMPMEAVLQWLRTQKKPQKVMVVITGGNMDQKTSAKIWAKDYLTEVPKL
ncbi:MULTISPECIES: serine/threonine dehydratase [Flavobacteriaceae]|uniref:serine/threonine dehydratase n=1 Tax=Flavobacteriaceae TaxID=49546 RepID=UPI0010AE0BF4|nr:MULTISPECIES: serine/threonine dehydratase [Flavobacteriaceae]NJB37435.1 serine/threonine dehydratase [Croceivirga sp. JEA036]TKD61400.1 serine/threonine dehydratase [Flavobacterium sp. ASW18X]